MTEKKTGTTLMSQVLVCTCEHMGQDKIYGKHMRLMNPMQSKVPGYKCTVCGAKYHRNYIV